VRNISIRGLVFSALFAAIIIAVSSLRIALPFSPVPITLTTLGVMLAGSVLGARYATLSVLIVLLLVAVGFPVLGGRGGISLLIGPSAGFFIAWPFATLLIGYFAQRVAQNKFTYAKLLLINFVFGSLILYPTGVSWLAYHTGIHSFGKALTAGMLPFLPGDLLKAIISAAVATAVWRVYPLERIIGRSDSANSKYDASTT
jgi:biotin transport system substrate-specific component